MYCYAIGAALQGSRGRLQRRCGRIAAGDDQRAAAARRVPGGAEHPVHRVQGVRRIPGGSGDGRPAGGLEGRIGGACGRRPQAEQDAQGTDAEESHGAPPAYHASMSRGPFDATLLRALPKGELHLHLDGSMRLSTALELADAAGLGLTEDEVRRRILAPERCADQAQLLTYFDLPIALLQSAEALGRGRGS